MLEQSGASVVEWLEKQNAGHELTSLIEKYLLARSTRTMISLLEPGSNLNLLAKFHDVLGWEFFIEGRIYKLWLVARNSEIAEKDLRATSESWSRGRIRRLPELTYRQ